MVVGVFSVISRSHHSLAMTSWLLIPVLLIDKHFFQTWTFSALVTSLLTNEVHRIEVWLSLLPGLQPQRLCQYAQHDCVDSLVDSTTLLFEYVMGLQVLVLCFYMFGDLIYVVRFQLPWVELCQMLYLYAKQQFCWEVHIICSMISRISSVKGLVSSFDHWVFNTRSCKDIIEALMTSCISYWKPTRTVIAFQNVN